MMYQWSLAEKKKGLETIAPSTCTETETLILWMVKAEAVREVCY